MQPTPVSLLERLREPGDRDAWDRFVRLYTPLLYHWAGRLGLAPDEAADLVQDVFVLLLDKLPGFTYDASRRFRGWLWTLTINKVRERRRAAPAFEELTAEDGAHTPDGVPAFVEEEYRGYVTGRALELLRRDFEPRTWRAYWEHVTNGRTAPVVAAELGVSVGAVYAAKTRVLARLREELKGLLD
jgi:RNA polymerase sigma-70 factor (ECF subfamily)